MALSSTGLFLRVLRVALLGAICGTATSHANNIGENGAWGFQSIQERAVRQTATDMAERRKGGYYEAARTTITNNTYIERQVNCSQTASASGNSGTNGMTAYTSSPVVSNTTGITAGSTGNSSTSAGAPGGSGVSNGQTNSGHLSSSVSGSAASGSTGAVNAGGGVSRQVLNSTQTNSGAQTASLNGSTACAGVIR